jgi:hypothetical protein
MNFNAGRPFGGGLFSLRRTIEMARQVSGYIALHLIVSHVTIMVAHEIE